eukprot:4655836-Heterocapsa_arctica.AAC.1
MASGRRAQRKYLENMSCTGASCGVGTVPSLVRTLKLTSLMRSRLRTICGSLGCRADSKPLAASKPDAGDSRCHASVGRDSFSAYDPIFVV